MKNKIAFASAFLAAASFSTAEIVVNDFLLFEGFVDSSYSHTDVENGMSDNENSFGIDQVEISWLFDFDTVTAQIDLQYEGDSNDGDLDNDGELVEQAFVTYHLDNDGAITAGRYASMLGFEAFEPTGLYQYSLAYDAGIGASALPGYAQGVKYTQESDTTFFGISIQDEAYDLGANQLGGNDGDSSHAIEVAGALDMGNGLAFFLGGVYEDGENDNAYAINAYTTFETGAWIFAAEVNVANFEGGLLTGNEEDVLQALLLANFAYSDQASVTGRLSYSEHDVDAANQDQEFLKYTAAHNYAFTDNLLLVTEVSYVDGEDGNVNVDGLLGAVELLFTF